MTLEITNDEGYRRALDVVSHLMTLDPPRDSADGALLLELVAEIERYEQVHHPIC